MKKLLMINFLIGFILIQLNAQILPSDSIRFTRYIEDTEKSVNIPLTNLYYLNNTAFKTKFGWISETSLKTDSLKDFFLIEMNSTDVPPGEWSDFTSGSFLLGFEIVKGTTSISLDTMNKSMLLLNHYATKGVNKPTNTLTGTLDFTQTSDQKVKTNGIINITSVNPKTRHEIIFKNALLPTTDYLGYVANEKKWIEKKRQEEEKMFGLMGKISDIETRFYDSLFSIEKYPKNKLIASFSSQKTFDFLLDRSYVVKDAEISDQPTDNLMDLLGSNIYYPVNGNMYVINLHHFFEGAKNIIDDETNYSLLIALPDLDIKTYEFGKKSFNKVKLAYWHYGPSGHIIESKNATGKLDIKKIEDGVVFGFLELQFKSTDKKTFVLSGDLQIPLVEKDFFIKLGDEIQKLINK